jgi:hypothetical protein
MGAMKAVTMLGLYFGLAVAKEGGSKDCDDDPQV